MSYKFGKKKQTGYTYAALVVFFVVMLIIFRSDIARFFSKPAAAISEPLWQVSQFIRGEIQEDFLHLQSKSSLVRNILHLQEKFVLLEDVVTQNEILSKENEELKIKLGLYREEEYSATAHVLKRAPQVAYDTMVIDLGSRDGISRGDLVFTDDRIYIGEITETHTDTSLVTLLSTSRVQTNVMFLRGGFEITLTGTGGGSFEGYVPKGADVSDDDILVSVANNSWHIADVVRIGGDAQDPSKKVIAKNPINLNHIKTVFIKRF